MINGGSVILAGIDEAGRGCLIGPLIIAGLTIEKKDIQKLLSLGVKDSKKISPKKRNELATDILKIAKTVKYFSIEPKFIDIIVNRNQKLRKLNYLEAMGMARIISELNPYEAYVDAADVNALRFANDIMNVLPNKPKLICEHKADNNYVIVGAASILAKVRRDSIITDIKKIYGDFNSGYPSDPKTINWLKNWYFKYNYIPCHVRSSWMPVKKIIKDYENLAKTNA
ncbi:ribonuclease HII [Candidatus Bathyarchaeota archaeon]|nr:ribonuclease HII [Candidatus Bathyarchaeota archaeon]